MWQLFYLMSLLDVSGSPVQVAAAIQQIKKRFPKKYYPDITYMQTNVPVELQTEHAPEIMEVNNIYHI